MRCLVALEQSIPLRLQDIPVALLLQIVSGHFFWNDETLNHKTNSSGQVNITLSFNLQRVEIEESLHRLQVRSSQWCPVDLL